MKKMTSIIAMLILVAFISTGCFSGAQNQLAKTGRNLTASDYLVILYSGGKPVQHWVVTNKVVNNEENSDGYYWFDEGRMVRVSGDIVVEEIKGVDLNTVLNKYSLR